MNPFTATGNKTLAYTFVAAWLLATVVLTWLLAAGRVSFALDSTWIVVLVLLPLIVILMRLVRNPLVDDPAGRKTQKGKLLGLIAALVIVCLYHDLETAIGFHFWMDLLKFAFALLSFNR